MPGRPAPDHVRVRADPERFGLSLAAGRLHVEGVSLPDIAAAVGTPAYVYSAGAVRARFEALARAVAGRPTLLAYAVKANSSQAILRLLGGLGAGADIVSGGELERVLAAGIDPARVVFSGVGKRDEEIDAALRAGVRSINAESEDEIEQVRGRARALGRRAPVSLRINPDVDPTTHPYLATGLREAKFGIPFERGLELALHAARCPELELVGLACHIGSQIMLPGPFLDSLARLVAVLRDLRQAGVCPRQLDLGGGMGIPYAFDDPDLDVAAWGQAIVAATRDLDLELVLEPGRVLVGNAGVLLTRVLGCKQGEERAFVIVDAAMNDLIRPALYGAYHAIVPTELPAVDAPTRVADVVGPVCESGDFLAQRREVTWPAVGDVWAVLSAGAYGMVMASTYNSRPLPPEVIVHQARFAVTRPRRAVAELIAEETVPDWLGRS